MNKRFIRGPPWAITVLDFCFVFCLFFLSVLNSSVEQCLQARSLKYAKRKEEFQVQIQEQD